MCPLVFIILKLYDEGDKRYKEFKRILPFSNLPIYVKLYNSILLLINA